MIINLIDKHGGTRTASLDIRSGANLHPREVFTHELTITPREPSPPQMKVLLTSDVAAAVAEELSPGDYTDGFINGQEDAVRQLRALIAVQAVQTSEDDPAVKLLRTMADALAEALGG